MTNELDADPGNPVETDTQLRTRWFLSLNIRGNATVEAITANLLEVPDVTDAVVVERTLHDNPEPIAGMPAHSFDAVVDGGGSYDIAEKIWLTKAAGIRAWGTDEVVNVLDSRGEPHVIGFDRIYLQRAWIHARIGVGSGFVRGTKKKVKVAPASPMLNAVINITVSGVTVETIAPPSVNSTCKAIRDDWILQSAGGDNRNQWLPIRVYLEDEADEYLFFESLYEGNDFELNWTVTQEPGSLIVETIVENSGDQVQMRQDMIDHMYGNGINAGIVEVGAPVFRAHVCPMFVINPEVQTVTWKWTWAAVGDPNFWPTYGDPNFATPEWVNWDTMPVAGNAKGWFTKPLYSIELE